MKRVQLLFCLFIFAQNLTSQTIKSPEETFGFRMGADRQLINWQQIVSYFNMLDEHSGRVQVVELGKTTLGRPMIMAIIGSDETMQNLEKYQKLQQQIARPFGLDEIEAEKSIRDGKLVFLITLNIHSNEIASSQESVELAYELATANDERTRKILDNVIVLLAPSLNPDGQDMITNWYLKDVGAEYEGSRMPMKYHHYADHDNNRDWFFFNLVESRHVAKVLYHEWYPEIVYDQHQMGATSARLFLPPYSDPVNPNVPPALMASVNMLGKHVVADLHHQGFTGVVTGAIFNAFFEGTMSKTPLWHNRIGILSEAASVRIATPVFFPTSSLRGMGIDLPDYSQQTNFLDPWPGGWWRLRDIIEYEKAATYSMLDLAATYKDKFKRDFYRLNVEAIAAGKSGFPFAYVVSQNQHDPNSALELLKRLRIANVDIYQAESNFSTVAGNFEKGDFVIPLAQPARAYIKDLMEIQQYPNLREYPGGPPRQPYDVTAWTLPLQMGVTAIQIDEPFSAELTLTAEPKLTIQTENIMPGWLAVERRYIHSYKLVNQLLKSGHDVFQLQEPSEQLPTGAFLAPVSIQQIPTFKKHLAALEIPALAFSKSENVKMKKLNPARIAIYQPWIPSIYDEGWLRLILDQFGFEYTVVHNADFKERARFRNHFDVLIFGSQDAELIVDGKSSKAPDPTIGEPKIRKEYAGGIEQIGVEKVRQFLEDGGAALFLGEACDFAIEHLNLPAANVLKDIKREDYFAPGSLFKLNLDLRSELTFGMPKTASIYMNNGVALELKPYVHEIRESGFYGGRSLLQSGWVVGEERLWNKIALAEIPVGKGRAILYAFRVHHRGQMFGTFKLLFNAFYN
jgi:hypothetical protein